MVTSSIARGMDVSATRALSRGATFPAALAVPGSQLCPCRSQRKAREALPGRARCSAPRVLLMGGYNFNASGGPCRATSKHAWWLSGNL
ncbi:hypothetical protein NDU88_010844 [Pleurodeles waltl]|uniref:Uncharacterized protein n=1 Tax=Pleurodeles waltl TaxID=8319 RepID=A0AAV7PZX1_PLEWA|nr:hypothetical protein NDU88_010844 [Pleurodeles waltl]